MNTQPTDTAAADDQNEAMLNALTGQDRSGIDRDYDLDTGLQRFATWLAENVASAPATSVTATLPTEQLVTAARSADASAWDALVDRYYRLVWRVVRSFPLSDADAADACQITWLRLVESLDTIKDPDRLAGWLATTAKHESLKVLRQTAHEIPASDEPGIEAEPGALLVLDEPMPAQSAPVPETVAPLGVEHRRLWRAYASLSKSCQARLRLVTATPEGRYAEVSAALDLPSGSMDPAHHRCLDRLHSALS